MFSVRKIAWIEHGGARGYAGGIVFAFWVVLVLLLTRWQVQTVLLYPVCG